MYDVPEAVRISQEPLFQGIFLSYANGNDVQKAFRADAGLPAIYLAVTGTDAAIVLAHDRSFIRENQYAFYSFTNSVYAARLADYDSFLNQTALLRGVEDLPQQFNGDNEDVLAAYKSFFQRFGSHVIVNANYGARFQLVCYTHQCMHSFMLTVITRTRGHQMTMHLLTPSSPRMSRLTSMVSLAEGNTTRRSNLKRSTRSSWNTFRGLRRLWVETPDCPPTLHPTRRVGRHMYSGRPAYTWQRQHISASIRTLYGH